MITKELEQKVCSRCSELKPFSAFNKTVGSKYWRAYCKPCARTYTRKTVEKYKERNTANPPPAVGLKRCYRCKFEKEKALFDRMASAPDGFTGKCKECAKSTAKPYREGHLNRNYGITEQTYLDMLAKQNHVCAVCFRTETRKKFKLLAVDHDHMTGKIRGLLCHKCNVVLGLVDDNKETLIALINYLK